MTKYNSNFNNTEPFSDTSAMLELAASTALPWVVPGEEWQQYRAEFSFLENDPVWVALNKVAVVPTPGTAVTISNQELRPLHRYVKGGDTLSFISTQANVQCGVRLLDLPSQKN